MEREVSLTPGQNGPRWVKARSGGGGGGSAWLWLKKIEWIMLRWKKNSWKFSSLTGEFCMHEKKDPADQTGCCRASIDHGVVFGPDMDSPTWALETLSESG